MEGKIIYFDQNILSEYLDEGDIDLVNAVNLLKGGNKIVYSPAHIEEFAVPYMNNSNEEIKFRVLSELNKLSELTRNIEVSPGFDKPMHLKEEHPIECFKRVVDHYDLNPILEKQESDQLKKFKDTDKKGEVSNVVSNNDSSILLQEEHSMVLNGRFHLDIFAAISARKAGLREFKYPDILRSHTAFERCIELTFNYLEIIRYKPETVKKSRSRMHDVSHAVYASTADIIVSEDAKFCKKLEAVYKYWGIDTVIYSKEKLISEVGTVENT
ncbi:hypothetical protein GPM19_15005 [Halomonas sp. ZH2S]|uniref:PIN domain-containing protein n=1 Tax=Vreelandella zhuhanensis TaxID=2684210 RepID=A0A7X3KS38_9GAMM|nr:hypothetical protein [Halomonas zhuhanensis]MWJ29488.1 hypothetical protein [Halomonas zhuhanensis]